MPSAKVVEHELSREPRPRRCVFEPSDLTEWDSSLVTFVTALLCLYADFLGILGGATDAARARCSAI
jgi:hypothetical protein